MYTELKSMFMYVECKYWPAYLKFITPFRMYQVLARVLYEWFWFDMPCGKKCVEEGKGVGLWRQVGPGESYGQKLKIIILTISDIDN